MKAWEVVGYTYDAAVHCPACAQAAGMAREGATDSEGNEAAPVFASSDGWESEACDDCGELLGGDDAADLVTCCHCGMSTPLCAAALAQPRGARSAWRDTVCESCGRNVATGDEPARECIECGARVPARADMCAHCADEAEKGGES